MHYVCIEDNKVIGIQSYQPAVPATVTTVTINNDQYKQIMDQSHVFDTASRQVVPVNNGVIAEKARYTANGIEREFLNSTDWKVMRHIRQKALNIPTTLSDAAYLQLEQQRQAAAAKII